MKGFFYKVQYFQFQMQELEVPQDVKIDGGRGVVTPKEIWLDKGGIGKSCFQDLWQTQRLRNSELPSQLTTQWQADKGSETVERVTQRMTPHLNILREILNYRSS